MMNGQHTDIIKIYSRFIAHKRKNKMSRSETSLLLLATCVNYADVNNSMLHMQSHVSAGFSACLHRDVQFLQDKHNVFLRTVSNA